MNSKYSLGDVRDLVLAATFTAFGCGSPSSESPRPGATANGLPNATATGSLGAAPPGIGSPEQPIFADLPVSGLGPTASPNALGNTTGLVRDFPISHPDFEAEVISGPGIVAPELGPDLKPIYVGVPTPERGPGLYTGGTHGQANFDQWYRSDDSVNRTIEFTLPLMPTGNGIASFSSNQFFPIDDQGFGNEFQGHNFHFTFELHTTFSYLGGEVFTFSGDDDLFVFINGRLAIDLGGVHSVQSKSISLDDIAAEFSLTTGTTYPLDLFHAERHTGESNFRIDTSLTFNNPEPILLR